MEARLLGRRVSSVRVGDISPEVDVTWLVAAILRGIAEKLVVLLAARTPHKNWQGQCLEIVGH